jgi:L-lactate dehydrogenase complex protein LldG
MSNAREKILGRVNAALAPLKERAQLPDWTPELIVRRAAPYAHEGAGGRAEAPASAVAGERTSASGGEAAGAGGESGSSVKADSWSLFAERMRGLHGIPIEGEAMLAKWLAENGWTQGYCDPELWPRMKPFLPEPTFCVSTVFDRTSYDDYQFGITWASGAIAETGTLILTDRDTPSRLAALAPWAHIAVLRREMIVPDIATALATMPKDPNVIWVSGPSKTADVEGILIEGVHGPGQQVALLI